MFQIAVVALLAYCAWQLRTMERRLDLSALSNDVSAVRAQLAPKHASTEVLNSALLLCGLDANGTACKDTMNREAAAVRRLYEIPGAVVPAQK